MATKLEKSLKREIDVNGVSYTVTLSPDGIRLVQKGHRKGTDLSWEQLIRGDVTLSQALSDSIALSDEEP